MKLKFLFAAPLALLVVAACETTSSRPYQMSTENVLAAQQALEGSDAKFNVGSFSAAQGVDEAPTCRALGTIEVAPGQSPVDYIREALQTELFAADLVAANGTAITGVVETLQFNSFGTGSWDVALQLSSPAMPEGYSVSTHYEFSTSFSAINACQNVIDAFQPTVASLLNAAINDPRFAQLAGE
ncbi:hypothetical protein [Ponticaulis koreensis]|uniref:hypothetical protein n=1 Tax=Ponticaulis koreensis TaxID=1123045 RepID=UPI0003B53D85|nr:hypothetical protein [Ponticaulis koreensis]